MNKLSAREDALERLKAELASIQDCADQAHREGINPFVESSVPIRQTINSLMYKLVQITEENNHLRDGLRELKKLYPKTPYKALNDFLDRLLEGNED